MDHRVSIGTRLKPRRALRSIHLRAAPPRCLPREALGTQVGQIGCFVLVAFAGDQVGRVVGGGQAETRPWLPELKFADVLALEERNEVRRGMDGLAVLQLNGRRQRGSCCMPSRTAASTTPPARMYSPCLSSGFSGKWARSCDASRPPHSRQSVWCLHCCATSAAN